MKRQPKRVQTKPLSFQDWWDKHGHIYGVEAFKPCRAAWNAAQGRPAPGEPSSDGGQSNGR